MLVHLHPRLSSYLSGPASREVDSRSPALLSGENFLSMPAVYREPLCVGAGVAVPAARFSARQPALPGFLRSYGLMRQTARLSTTSVVPIPSSLCRLRRAPADVRPFPTLSLRSLYRRLGPYPATVPRCFRPFLPAELRPRQRVKQLGPWDAPATQFYAGRNFGAATIRSCSGSATCLAHRLLRRSGLSPCRRWAVYTGLYSRRYRSANSGIATCPNRTTDTIRTRGRFRVLSSTGPQPCRLLMTPLASHDAS
jgi:hypothetical protein